MVGIRWLELDPYHGLQERIFLCILSLALTSHIALYAARRGRRYFTVQFAPALGLLLPRRIFVLTQIAAVPVLIYLPFAGEIGTYFCFVLLGIWLLSQDLRFSNHLLVAVLALIALVFSPAGLTASSAAVILGATYLIAGLLKLNASALAAKESVLRFLTIDFLQRHRLPRPIGLVALTPPITVIMEIGLGVSILLGVALWICLLVALTAHLLFGLFGHFHFSLVCLALWSQVLQVGEHLPIDRLTGITGVIAALIMALLGYKYCTHWVFPNPIIGRATTGTCAAIYGVLAYFLIVETYTAADLRHEWSTTATVLAATLLLNVALLATGYKTEWSLAMFGNIRPYHWTHSLLPRPTRWRCRYYQVDMPTESMRRLEGLVPPEILRKLSDSEAAFLEPVTARLVDLCGEAHAAINVRSLTPDENKQQLVPETPPSSRPPKNGPILFPPVLHQRFDVPYFG